MKVNELLFELLNRSWNWEKLEPPYKDPGSFAEYRFWDGPLVKYLPQTAYARSAPVKTHFEYRVRMIIDDNNTVEWSFGVSKVNQFGDVYTYETKKNDSPLFAGSVFATSIDCLRDFVQKYPNLTNIEFFSVPSVDYNSNEKRSRGRNRTRTRTNIYVRILDMIAKRLGSEWEPSYKHLSAGDTQFNLTKEPADQQGS